MTVVLISSLGKKGAGNFYLVLEEDVKGGYRTVETIAQRDAIPEWARKPGMKVSVIEENFAEYRLGVDTTIAGQVWTLVDRASDALTQDDLGETVVPLDGDKKIDPIYLPNIFLNTVYSVETIPEMLALTTFTGNAVIVADTGDGNAATYFKINDNSPSVIGDFVQILFPGSVVSVNGMTGAVTITLQGLLSISENLTAFNNAVLNSPAITNINTTLGGHTNSINDINQAISDIINQLDELIGQIHGSGIVLYEDKEWEAGKYVEYENEGVNGIYRSIQNVPSGIPPSDTDYWILVSGQIQSANSDEATTGQDNKKYLTPKTNLDALINWLGTGLSWNSVGKKINSLFTQSLKDKLDGIQSEATKNASDAQLRDRSTHTGEQPINSITGLQVELDGKLAIRGDNFISTRPTANKTANGTQLQNIINELANFTPGGNPLSHTNRAYVLVMPGEYNGDIYLGNSYIDIIGFGSKNGIIINGNINVPWNEDHRIENLTVVGRIECYSHTEVCVYRNLSVSAFWCDTLGTFENIEHIDIGGDDYLFESLSGGVLKNIYTPKGLGGYPSTDFEGIIEECRVEGQHLPIGLSGTVTRSYFKGNNGYDAIFDLYDGAEISYTTIINESDQETGTEWAVKNYSRYGAPDNDVYVKIHHCNFEAKDGALSPKVINTIEHGHNSWDEEKTGDGIEDIIAGSNISIDKTDPKKPVISSTGEGSSLIKATQAQAEAGTDDAAYMTALKVLQSIASRASEGIEWDSDKKKFKLGGKAAGNIDIILGDPDEYEIGGYFRVYAPSFPGVINDFKIDNDGTSWGDNSIWWFVSTENELNVRLDNSSANLYLNRLKFLVEANSSYLELIGGGGDEPGELLGFSIKTESPNSFALKSYVDGRVDEIVAGTGAGVFMPVQDITALKAIDTTNSETHPDKWLIHVEDAGLYRFDRDSSAPEDSPSVIAPTVGVGRWIKLSSAITSHELLSNIQGGTTGEHYHLTAAEYLIMAATELPFTNAIKSEIESKLTEDDLPSGELVRSTVTVVAGEIDLTDIDIADIELTENTTIVSIVGMVEGSKIINLVPNGYTFEWSASLVNPLNVDGVADTEEDSLIMLLCSSTDPFRLKIKTESNPSPVVPKVNLILNHGNINTTGPAYSNLFYQSTTGAVTTGLHNVDLTPSSVEVEINPTFSISVANNKNTGLSGDEPNEMLKGVFLNNQTTFGRTFDIINLDDEKTYTISMILCNDTAGAKTDISINGGAVQTFDTFELTTYQEIGSFSPISGRITVGFAKNAASTQDAYLCVTKIVED